MMLSLRVELKTSRLLNGCSNQLSYESFDVLQHSFTKYITNTKARFFRTESKEFSFGGNCYIK